MFTFKEDDPPPALVVPPDVVSGHRAVVARDLAVVEELAVEQPVLGPLVQGLGQLPEGVRRQALWVRMPRHRLLVARAQCRASGGLLNSRGLQGLRRRGRGGR